MNDDLNFKSWQVEGPSSEVIEGLLVKARSKVSQRRRRRIGAGVAVALIASTAVLYGLFGRTNFENELAEARKMIEKEINDSREMTYYAENERLAAPYVREDYHDFRF